MEDWHRFHAHRQHVPCQSRICHQGIISTGDLGCGPFGLTPRRGPGMSEVSCSFIAPRRPCRSRVCATCARPIDHVFLQYPIACTSETPYNSSSANAGILQTIMHIHHCAVIHAFLKIPHRPYTEAVCSWHFGLTVVTAEVSVTVAVIDGHGPRDKEGQNIPTRGSGRSSVVGLLWEGNHPIFAHPRERYHEGV